MCTGTHDYIPVPNTVRVDLFMRDDGQHIENVFHVRSVAAWDLAAMANLYSVFETWAATYYFAALGVQVVLSSIKITDLSSESGGTYESQPFSPLAGAQTGGFAYPSSAALVIKWLTTSRGRSYRGRTYVPGMRTIFASENTVTGTEIAAITEAARELWLGVRSAGHSLAVVSLCNGGAWRTTGVATDIVSWSVDDTIDSQRRRLPGRGQ